MNALKGKRLTRWSRSIRGVGYRRVACDLHNFRFPASALKRAGHGLATEYQYLDFVRLGYWYM